MENENGTEIERLGSIAAILAGVASFLYAVAFAIIERISAPFAAYLYSLFQLLGGVLTTLALVALYRRVREVEGGVALWALLLGTVSALGAAIHGGYDLANAINLPASDPLASTNLPSQIDPRGLLTFGLAALSVAAFSWLMLRSRTFPALLGYLGYVLAALLIILYLGRLVILNANSMLILVPAVLAGFLVNPAWYIWLGLVLGHKTSEGPASAVTSAATR